MWCFRSVWGVLMFKLLLFAASWTSKLTPGEKFFHPRLKQPWKKNVPLCKLGQEYDRSSWWEGWVNTLENKTVFPYSDWLYRCYINNFKSDQPNILNFGLRLIPSWDNNFSFHKEWSYKLLKETIWARLLVRTFINAFIEIYNLAKRTITTWTTFTLELTILTN